MVLKYKDMGLNLNNIKNDVQRLTCSVHDKHPTITIVGSNLNFECCCEKFKEICLEKSKKAFGNEIQKSVTESFGKVFKKLK